MKYLPIFDEDGYESEFQLIVNEYGETVAACYEGDLNTAFPIRVWNNHMAPYEDCTTGILYDDSEYMCYKHYMALGYEF